MIARRLGYLAPLLVAGVVTACSDDARPAASSSSSGNVVGDGGPTADAGARDAAATITPRPDLCEGLALGGEAVSELALLGAAPLPLGGAVAPGVYDLTEANVYTGPAPADAGGEGPVGSTTTGRTFQGTITVTAFELQRIHATGMRADDGDAGLAAPTTRASLYRVEGTNLLETEVCPTTALPAPAAFSAVGNSLAVFPDATHRLLYVLRE